MAKSLLEQLPSVVDAGKRQAVQILEQLEGENKVSLQTRELATSSRRRRSPRSATITPNASSAPPLLAVSR